ncbi:hypothetical protein [Flavilitoribacter nigricans]|uniref:T9SS type A sorting domain-containing protein n=1 Tax=Flavilitoribacter nigricans (strain ATCC 23147 / DSM 23189 / NBRC 102662 / NCIMB 1420 / SS-2) TaxID=1122177 RepID=A0A2D0N882_FLAN2|nr:hypothetical protein [Flavilitoribacter nigricans]PHN04724.1 hypothetical protein CRP01_19610 [Flavilitoribacter nigricans DSM 23189 = NBRC 102662]
MMRCLLALALLSSAQLLYATHNRTGYISYEQTGPLTIEAEIITYTRASSRPADRDTLTICWGDGVCEKVIRTNGDGVPPSGVELGDDFKFNIYRAEHTYASRDTYVISMTDPNRDTGILNVNPPDSEQIAFHLQAMVRLLDPDTEGINTSPRILNPTIDLINVGQVYAFNPNAYDVDGDSIVYELVAPLQGINEPVPNFSHPNEIDSGGNNLFQVDPITGQLTWDTPNLIGKYNIGILFKSYRNGELIDQFILDMELLVRAQTTDTEELEWARQNLRIFPNPAFGQSVQVEFSNWQEAVPYRIFNPLGQFLREGQLRDRISRIELPVQAGGTYIISFWNGRRWVPQRFQLL